MAYLGWEWVTAKRVNRRGSGLGSVEGRVGPGVE